MGYVPWRDAFNTACSVSVLFQIIGIFLANVNVNVNVNWNIGHLTLRATSVNYAMKIGGMVISNLSGSGIENDIRQIIILISQCTQVICARSGRNPMRVLR